jgi:hypothetical protein
MSDVITSAVPFEHPEQTGPLDPHEINPKMASDIAYWSKALGVTGEQLHEAIRVHGTRVGKVCAALSHSQGQVGATRQGRTSLPACAVDG